MNPLKHTQTKVAGVQIPCPLQALSAGPGQEVGGQDAEADKSAAEPCGICVLLVAGDLEEVGERGAEVRRSEFLSQRLELWPQVGQLAAGAAERLAEGAFGKGDEQRAERLVSW